MKVELEIGDSITCYKNCIMIDSNKKQTTINKNYFIIEIVECDRIMIKNDSNEEHYSHRFYGHRQDDDSDQARQRPEYALRLY